MTGGIIAELVELPSVAEEKQESEHGRCEQAVSITSGATAATAACRCIDCCAGCGSLFLFHGKSLVQATASASV